MTPLAQGSDGMQCVPFGLLVPIACPRCPTAPQLLL